MDANTLTIIGICIGLLNSMQIVLIGMILKRLSDLEKHDIIHAQEHNRIWFELGKRRGEQKHGQEG